MGKHSGKTERVDVNASSEPLTDNPFAALRGAVPEKLPAGPDKPSPVNVNPPFRIERTRKGGYPIAMERRAAGKSVTIIRNVSGDVDALLSLLKKHCAAGGKAFEDSVEVQGDHGAKIEAFLREKGY